MAVIHHHTLLHRILDWAAQQTERTLTPASVLRWLTRVLAISLLESARNMLALRAAALTYTVLLALVPVLAISTAVFKGLGGEDQLHAAAHRYLDTLEDSIQQPPPANQPGESSNGPLPHKPSSLITHLRTATDNLFIYVEKIDFTTLGLAGLLALFLSAFLVFSHLENALNRIWHVQRGRSLARRLTDYLAVLIMMPLSVNIAFAAAALQKSQALAASFQAFIPYGWQQNLLLKLLPFLGMSLTLLVVYIIFPRTRVRSGPALLGAALASLCWLGVQNLYLNLQIGLSSLNAIYGSFAALPLFFTWLYGGLACVLLGAQVAFACQHASSYSLLPATGSLALRLHTALKIMNEAQRAFANQGALRMPELISLQPQTAPRLLAEMTEELLQTGLLHQTTTGQLLPSAPADQLDQPAILNALLKIREQPPA